MQIEDRDDVVEDELRRRERQQRAVAELGRLALTGADMPTLFEAAVESVADALDTELASILQHDSGFLVCRAQVGWSAAMIRPVPVDAQSQIAYTFQATQPVVVDDLAQDPRFPASRHLVELGLASAISAPIRGDGAPVGVVAAHARQARTFSEDDVLFLRAVANGLAAAIAREHADAARRATEERLRFLAEASEALTRSLDYRTTLAEVARLVVPRVADRFTVELLDDGRLEAVAGEPVAAALEVVRTGEAALTESALHVPLEARGDVVGVVTLDAGESGRTYGDDDVAFATELARRLSVAIENARLHEREHEARTRTERLQAVTAALARALTAAEVYDVLLREGRAAAGATAAVVGTVTSDGGAVEVQAHTGYPPGRLDDWQRFPLDAELPLSLAARTEQPCFCETNEERHSRFRTLARVQPHAPPHAFVTLPLRGRSGPIGGIAFSYGEERRFSSEERELLTALGAQAGQALERALLHEQADRQREHARFLADASDALAGGADTHEALRRVTELALERVASRCVVERGAAPPPEGAVPIVGPDGVLGSLLLVTGVDADGRLLAEELARRIAVAIENADARRAAQDAAERIARLQAATASLARARTQAEVAEIVVTEGVAALGAVAGWLGLLNEDGSALERAAAAGAYPESMRLGFHTIPLDATLPGAQVVREGRSLWFPSADALAAAYPELAAPYRESGFGAVALVPVASDGPPRGFMTLNFAVEREFGADELRLLETLGSLCAQALDRARLYDEREARANASFVLEHVADGVVQVDEQGRIGLWNAAAERITGVSAGAAVGRRIGDVLAGWAAGIAGSGQAAAAFPVTADGRELWLSVSAVHRGAGGVFAFRDLTEEHALEETRRDFLATASHELRTPLAAVYGAALTLCSGAAIGGREHDQLLRMIVKESERLSRILDDMLLANRIDAGAMLQNSTSCDTAGVAREVLELVAQRAREPVKLVLSLADDVPPVQADEDALRQVLVNLLDNAIKYSPEGGLVELAVGAENGRVRFAVADEGLGIPAAEQQRIFEKFYRLDPNLRRGIGGTGLYICRGLVERMGGTIAVSSAEGVGSTFVVEVPRAT